MAVEKRNEDSIFAAPTPTKKADEVVRYVGTANVKEISVADWKKAGAGAVETGEAVAVKWSEENNFRVSREDLGFLTDDEFERMIRADRGFRVESPE